MSDKGKKEKREPYYTINTDGPDICISEHGNTTLMFREVSWNNRPPKLELRKWHIDSVSEVPGKGLTFYSKEEVDCVVESLAKHNYGNTEKLLQGINEREDFEEALVHTIGQKKVIQARNTEYEVEEEPEYYDPKNLV